MSVARQIDYEQSDADLPPVISVTPAEERRMFDEMARAWVGMSGDEYIRRWKAGEFANIPDDLEHRRYIELSLMVPLADQDA